MLFNIKLTDYIFLLKSELHFKMESDKTFQDIKDVFFNTLKERNIDYDEIYYKNFQIVTFGRVVKMNELLEKYNDAYDLVLKVNIIINDEFRNKIISPLK